MAPPDISVDELRQAAKALEANDVPTDADTWMFETLICGHSVALSFDPNKDGFIVGDVGTEHLPLQTCCINALREKYRDASPER